MKDTEIEHYALNFIEKVLKPLNSDDLRLEFSHYISYGCDDLNIAILVKEGTLNDLGLREKVLKYGFEIYITVANGIDFKTNKLYKIYTIYKELSEVLNDIRVKGLKELLEEY